ncbi:hypothetical protein [Streptomyces qinglanensis]|uniref:Uncharacterized protein n=1 Tax=Streptomyces qinglanensis TaxID=943816 RepID=A0A1H9U0S9_9ACTN|nr:hypothetical protein [Streptomyces qinglanensis]SES03230.1 hypothetical protein SAMN05421870_107216 [Streptomyces qinglanensis]
MPTDDYGQGVPWLENSDKPDLRAGTKGLADALTPRSMMRYSTAAERNATITSPVAGMVAWLDTEMLFTGYDGTAWVVLAAGSQQWTTISLASGYAHDGNSNGTAQYRLVNLFGETSLMFRGGVGITYSSGTPPNSSQINATTLPVNARPATKRTISCACSVIDTTLSSVKLDINSDGTLVLIGIGSTSENPPWVSLNGCFASL